MIDIVLIEYSKGVREVCKAPFASLSVGNKVQTDFGTGSVLDVCSIYEDNRVLELFNACHIVMNVLAVIKELKYEEPHNDLSDI